MDAVTGTYEGQANTFPMAHPTQYTHSESAAAAMEDDVLNKGISTGNEAVHTAEAFAPTSRPAPLPMLSQVADDSVPPQHNQAVAHLAGDMKIIHLYKDQATAQPPHAAATTQPSDSHATYPAQALPTGQSGNANSMPRSTCDQLMTEADGDHAPSQQAGVDTSGELADGGATAQLVQGAPAAEVTEGTLAEPADAEPGNDEGAVPMQTDLPTSTDHKMPLVDKSDQPASTPAVIGVEAHETALPQGGLQSNRANVADAQHSTQSETMAKVQSGLDHPALECADSDALPDSDEAGATTPAETASRSFPGTVAVQQEVGSTCVRDSLACGFAQPDTDMVPITSHGDQLSDHPQPEAEPSGRYPGSCKQTLPSALKAHSDVELRDASENANSPSNEAISSIPAGIEM